MRRILLISVLLAASHGTALWLGARRQVGHGTAVASPEPGKAEAARTSLGSWVEAGRELAARRDAEEEADFEAEVDRAAERLSPDADFLAILEAGVANPYGDFSPETMAAIRRWLEKDPLAALCWISDFHREYRSSDFEEELGSYLKKGGTARLQEFIEAEPRIRSYLLECSSRLFWKDDGSGLLKLAATLKSPADRLLLMGDALFASGSLAGNLASIRALLDERTAAEFLERFSTSSHANLLEEVRDAGFPERAVRRFERDSQKKYPDGKINRNNIDAMLNNPNRAHAGMTWDSLGRTADFIGSLPEAPAMNVPGAAAALGINITDIVISEPGTEPQVSKETDFISPELAEEITRRRELLSQGRLTPGELASWLKEVGPADPKMDRRVVEITLATGLDSDPVGTLSWLKEARSDWRELMNGSRWRRLPPETLADLAGDFTEEMPETAAYHNAVASSFEEWLESDAEACLNEIDRMPPGPLRDRLLDLGKEEEEDE